MNRFVSIFFRCHNKIMFGAFPHRGWVGGYPDGIPILTASRPPRFMVRRASSQAGTTRSSPRGTMVGAASNRVVANSVPGEGTGVVEGCGPLRPTQFRRTQFGSVNIWYFSSIVGKKFGPFYGIIWMNCELRDP